MPGRNLQKLDVKKKEGREMELRKQKLVKMGQAPTPEKQEKEKEEVQNTEPGAPINTDDMPTLISDDEDDDDNPKGVKKKKCPKCPPSTPGKSNLVFFQRSNSITMH